MQATVTDLLGLVGALSFGVVMGWVTYGTLRRTKRSGLTDISTVLGALAGAAVTRLFPIETGGFGAYCLGLAFGFFGYLLTATHSRSAPQWLGEAPGSPDAGKGSAGRLPEDA